jgi:hypothetical protein
MPECRAGQPEFRIRDRGRTTDLYLVRGGGLVVEQRQSSTSPVNLSHYDEPGAAFFVGLLKFLHESNSGLPEVKAPNEVRCKVFTLPAIFTAKEFAVRGFPVSYNYYYHGERQGMPPPAKLQINLAAPNGPELNVTASDERDIVISVAVARKLVQKIPELYPGFGCFHAAYTAFLQESKKYALEPLLRKVPFLAGRQGCIQSTS